MTPTSQLPPSDPSSLGEASDETNLPSAASDDADGSRTEAENVRPQLLKGADAVKQRLNGRSIVLVGLMGAGKSTTGRRLAAALKMPFLDADQEIEAAAGMSTAEIFAHHGEAAFRDGERRVIARLLNERQMVLATGGGAFMNEETRSNIAAKGISLWIKAELDVLMKRVKKRDTRPLLRVADPEAVMRNLMEIRHPVYAMADVIAISGDTPHDQVVVDMVAALNRFLDLEAGQ